MTVQDLIDRLQGVKDKSKEVVVEDLDLLEDLDCFDQEAVFPVWVNEFNDSVTIWISHESDN